MASLATDRVAAHELELRPFRALRYDANRVGDLWAVTSPPYDVLDAATVEQLLRHPYNIVRLIVPRRPAGEASPYAAVAHLLQSWRGSGVLVTDERPGLYVYEYTGNGNLVRGLIGGVGVYDPGDGVVLPHEEVMSQPVEDRLALMLATRANLEPILLVYDGGSVASTIVEQVAQSSPLSIAVTQDGCEHRIWQIGEAAQLAAVAADLAPRQALIADGHHRYATYRRLLAEHPQLGGADVGLALLVDQSRYPLTVGAIHRTISGVSLETVARSAHMQLHAHTDRESALAALARTDFVVTDGTTWHTAVLRRAPSEPAEAIARLHEQLLTSWGVAEEAVGYRHDMEATVLAARRTGGIAVLTKAPSVAEVMAAARVGARMPRKSTSFSPKPRMGLVMRSLGDG